MLSEDTTAKLGKNSQVLSTPTASQLAIDLDLGGTSIQLGNAVAIRKGSKVYGRWSDAEASDNSTSLQVGMLVLGAAVLS